MSKIRIIITTVGLLCSLMAIGGCGSSQDFRKQEVPVSVQQIPTARDIARQLGGSSYRDLGPAPITGVASSGNFWLGGVKYAVATFASEDARDSWLKMSQSWGVSPKWMTSTSVVYPSIINRN